MFLSHFHFAPWIFFCFLFWNSPCSKAPLYRLATMDLGPQQKFKFPTRSKPSSNGPSIEPLPLQENGTTVCLAQCWVSDRAPPLKESSKGSFTTDQVTSWLKAPSPVMGAGVIPAAGLRVVCWVQESTFQLPFDTLTFNAVQEALDVPKSCSYLHLPRSGACGKYMGLSGQRCTKRDPDY